MSLLKDTPIDTKAILSKKIETESGIFHRLNSSYTSFSNRTCSNPTVWQQMSINYFFNLLTTNRLFFKRISAFTARDERPLDFYEATYFKDTGTPQDTMLHKIIQDFTDTVYISCWYHSDNLTDIVFKEYAKGSVGVAIGTDVNTLLNKLVENADSDSPHSDELFYGDTVYLGDLPSKTRILTDSSDLITPLFVKSENHNDDREFRLAYIKNSYYLRGERFSSTTISPDKRREDNLNANIGSTKELIKQVAVRSDDPCTLALTKYLLEQFITTTATVNTEQIDGFTVIKL